MFSHMLKFSPIFCGVSVGYRRLSWLHTSCLWILSASSVEEK